MNGLAVEDAIVDVVATSGTSLKVIGKSFLKSLIIILEIPLFLLSSSPKMLACSQYLNALVTSASVNSKASAIEPTDKSALRIVLHLSM